MAILRGQPLNDLAFDEWYPAGAAYIDKLQEALDKVLQHAERKLYGA